jgi:hypothetical protein
LNINEPLFDILYSLVPNHPLVPPCACNESTPCTPFPDYSTGTVPPPPDPTVNPLPPDFGDIRITSKSAPLAPSTPVTYTPVAIPETSSAVIYGKIYLHSENTTEPLSLSKAIELTVNLDSPSSIIITFSDIVTDSPTYLNTIAQFISNYALSLNMVLNSSRVTVTVSSNIATITIADTIPHYPTPIAPIPTPTLPTPPSTPSFPAWVDNIYHLSLNGWNQHEILVQNSPADLTIIISILSTQNAVVDIYLLYDDINDLPNVSTVYYSCNRLGLSTTIGYWKFDWKQDARSSICRKLEKDTLKEGRILLGVLAKSEVVYQVEYSFTDAVNIPPFADMDSVPGGSLSLAPLLSLLLFSLLSSFII